MGIRTYTYRDIPAAMRARVSSDAQKRLQSVLADPVATPSQREQARLRQAAIRDWAGGTLAEANKSTEAVVVTETVTVSESDADEPPISVEPISVLVEPDGSETK